MTTQTQESKITDCKFEFSEELWYDPPNPRNRKLCLGFRAYFYGTVEQLEEEINEL